MGWAFLARQPFEFVSLTTLVKENVPASRYIFFGWVRDLQMEHLYASAWRVANKLAKLGFIYRYDVVISKSQEQ